MPELSKRSPRLSTDIPRAPEGPAYDFQIQSPRSLGVRHIRCSMIRLARESGPGLILVIAICAAGLGLHAAHDWHRHGDFGSGSYHLHFHVGLHQHPTHNHAVPTDHDHDQSDEESPERPAVFTLALAVHDTAPAASTPTPPDLTPDRAPVVCTNLPRNNDGTLFANPRGPPT